MDITDKRIALHVPTLVGGGAERVMINLANEYARRGLNVEVVLYRREGEHLSELASEVKCIGLEGKKAPVYSAMGSFLPLREYLKERSPDIFLSGLTRANAVAILAKATTNVDTRLIVTEHNHLASTVTGGDLRRLRMLPMIARVTYPFADEILAVSNGVADSLAEVSGLPRESIQTIYNPVVTDELRKKAQEPCDHPWLASQDGPPVILGAGSLTPQKNFQMLIRAFDQIRQSTEAKLVIISEGELRDQLERQIDRLGLDDYVDLPGFVDNPYSYMNAADVFALSSKWEGLPTVLIEAMACGTPVVSTDCPSGPAEILQGGKYGPLVPVDDTNGFANALIDTLHSPPKEEKLQQRANDFSVEKVADEYLDLFFSR